MNSLIRGLKPLRKRLYINRMLSIMLTALCVGVYADMVIIIMAKLMYISCLWIKVITIPAFCAVIGLAITIILRPKYDEVAGLGDSLGYKERFLTAYELLSKENNSDIEKMMVEDAVKTAESADFKALYPIHINDKYLMGLFIGIVLCVVLVLIPSPLSEKILDEKMLKEEIAEEIKNIKEINGEPELTEKQQKAVTKEIEKLEKMMRKVKTEGEAVKELQKSQQELKKIVNEAQNKSLKELSEKLSENELTRNLGEMLKNGNTEKFKEEIENVSNELANMSKEDINNWAKALNETAEKLSSDNEAKELINQLTETMSRELNEDTLNEINGKLDEFADMVDELSKENKELKEAVDKINKAMADSSNELSGNNSKSTNDENSQNNSQQQGANDGQSQQQGEGNGSQQNEEGGAAAGGSNSQNGQQGGGSQRGTGHIENENVYSRQAEGYGEYDAEIDGEKNSGGSEIEKDVKTIGEAGQSIGYKEIYQEYKEDALNSMESEDIPYGVREIVKDYFTRLD